jgi:purine catabolism regulator
MRLTVESLLAELGLELISGSPAQANIRWVHSTELLDPTPWLTGGELLLTAGAQLTTPQRQRTFVSKLVEHHIAALGFGVGHVHEKVPIALLSAARKLDFPVFEIPYGMPFIAITERGVTVLMGEQYETLRRSMSIQERLELLVLDERGLDGLVRVVSEATGTAVGVLDAHGTVLAWDDREPALEACDRQEIAGQIQVLAASRGAGASPLEASLGGREGHVLALPVVARDRAAAQAWLVAVSPELPLGDFAQLIMRQSATIVALELMHMRIERETERRLAGDVLAEALSGHLHPEELRLRLQPFGIGEQAAVLAFATKEPNAAAPLLERALEHADARGLVAIRGGLLCAVVNSSSLDPMELAREARTALAAGFRDVRAAVSRSAPTQALRLSFHEARCALEAVRIQNGRAPEVASHNDLGAFQLLLALQDDDALASYCQSVLGPVLESEGDYGDELLRSLDVFIEYNGHWERAAAALYCHRHTLRYRIKRVEQLTGRDFSRARDRIEFWLALRGRELAR